MQHQNNLACQIKKKDKSIASFLRKTYDLLNDSENMKCINWATNGTGFVIHDQEVFSRVVLPKYFRHSNYSSFVRQLNMYNFHKVRQNSAESHFHHQSFNRFNMNALGEIRRKPEKKKKREDQENEEPNQLRELVVLGREKVVDRRRKVRVGENRTSIEAMNDCGSDRRMKSEKNTAHIFEEEGLREQCLLQGEGESSNNLSVLIEENQEKGEEVFGRIPRMLTKELISASKDNIFPLSIGLLGSSLSIFD